MDAGAFQLSPIYHPSTELVEVDADFSVKLPTCDAGSRGLKAIDPAGESKV
jgi:hypothetical protein